MESNYSSSLEGIAVVGMSGRFPGAGSVEEFWRNLSEGVESISRFGEDDMEYSVATDASRAQGQRVIRARSVLDGVDLFDADFFGMYPKEAELTDPQHRLFLECAWEALENSGHAPESYPGLIGVYAGLSMNTYLLNNLCADRAFAANFAGNYQVGVYQIMLGNDKDFLPTRVSYKLNLRGPSIAVQSACSTSLVAICQACTALLTFQCDMALAGGVSITFPQKRDYFYQEEGMVSADGTCRTFDAKACGTVFGHGVAVVLLKRIEDAVADGDNILAVIKGTALNNDGSAKVGYAAPSVKAQADVIAMAQSVAGVHPETISYIEAHGTATPLGDPIEIAALTEAFRRGGAVRNQYCAIGTGKTNIGHLDVAAGATGLIKTVLQLQHESIPPLLHFNSPNPRIDFAGSPFYPVAATTEWRRGAIPRRAGVSAFGVGGTNAHIVVEEAPVAPPSGPSRDRQMLLLSARSPAALDAMSDRLANWLSEHPTVDLADVAFTLNRGRQRFKHRQAICAASVPEAVEKLRTRDPKSAPRSVGSPSPSGIAFVFPGQGSQYVNMGRDLYESEVEFREAIDECSSSLQGLLDLDIRTVLYPAAGIERASEMINETWVTQPSTFVVEYALARLWMSWGVKPAVVLGHSVGEYVAAVLAGSLTLDEALGLLATRARLMQDLPPGSMLAVRKGIDGLTPLLSGSIAVAAVNGPAVTTLSGPTPDLSHLQQVLESQGIACRMLPTSHAFHSAMMDPVVEPFARAAAGVPARPPSLPWMSSFTGAWMDPSVAPEPSYWAGQLRHPVLFSQAAAAVLDHGITTFLEVGPGQALAQLIRQQPAKQPLSVETSIGPEGNNASGLGMMLNTLGKLWTLGLEPDWDRFYSVETRHRLPLPTYPFERKSYWIEAPSPEAKSSVPLPAPVVRSGELLPDGGLGARRLIERQIRLMAEQLEAVRASTYNGVNSNGTN
jgi:acyl transferase domain-containing protein